MQYCGPIDDDGRLRIIAKKLGFAPVRDCKYVQIEGHVV